MKSTGRLIALLLVGLVALSGCSAVRSILSGGSGAADMRPPILALGEVVAEPTAPRFRFYDSWASW